MHLRGEALGLSAFGGQVQRDQPARARLQQGLAQLGNQQMRNHAAEPLAGPEHHPISLGDRRQCFRAGRRVRRDQLDRHHWPGRGCHGILTDHRVDLTCQAAVAGETRPTRAWMFSAVDDIGSTRPCAPSRRATQSRPSTWPPSSSHNATMSRSPAAWLCSPPLARSEPVLQDAGPGSAPLVVAAQCGQCHPQVTWWQHTEVMMEATTRPTVVGDRDDRRAGPLTRRKADAQPARAPRRGRRPWDPPAGEPRRTRSFSAEIAMDHDGVDAPLAQPGGKRLTHRHAAVFLPCNPPLP